MRYFFIIFSVFVSGSLFSQAPADLPKIVQPSPETAALFRFQDYPMDYSTGLPQISIPIYEAVNGSLSVPISLAYHSSGRRVSDVDGPVAVGWSLNAGGMVSRTVYGSEDFGAYKFPYPFKINDINYPNDIDYLKEVIHWDLYNSPGYFKDSEYDEFSYSMGNLGGKFVFKDNNGVKTAALIPYKPYVVKPLYVEGGGLTGIEITDDKGIFYAFAANEIYNAFSGKWAYTGYSLTKMISADKVDTISFKYTTFMQTRTSISQSWVLDDMWNSWPGTYLDYFSEIPTQVENKNTDNYQIARLTEIDFREGKVKFNLVAGSDRIDNIQIIDASGAVFKTIQFTRSTLDLTSDGNPPTNKLDELVFKDNANSSVEKYVFEYFPTSLPFGANGIDLRYCDYWGYYNASGIREMVPYYYVDFKSIGVGIPYPFGIGDRNANRKPDLNGLKSGVLKKITYPTGGTTEFNYENNKYLTSAPNSQVALGPGLRISQVVTNDNRGSINSKTFKYGANECGYSFIDLEPNLSNMSSQLYYKFYHSTAYPFSPNDCGWFRKRTYYSGFAPGLGAVGDRPVIYREVTEYHGTLSNNVGKTIFKYEYSPWAVAGMPAGLLHIANRNYWNNPSLRFKTDYKFNQGLGSYQTVREIEGIYTDNLIEDVVGLHVMRLISLPQTGEYGIPSADIETFVATQLTDGKIFPLLVDEPTIIYSTSEYRIPIGIKNLSTIKETFYNDDGTSILNTTSYAYNAKQYISQTSRISSKGETSITEVKYPFDFTGNAVLSQMTASNLNMLNYPVEQNEYKNSISTLLKSTRTNYFNWGSTTAIIRPQTVEQRMGAGSFETRLRFLSHDSKGNPTTLSKENDVLYSYVYDYKKKYPVAEVTNADSTSIASTSFEADGNGGWFGINKANIKNDINGITGKRYYNLTGSTLSRSGLTSATTYFVTYWSRGGSCTVSGTPQSGWPKNLKSVTLDGTTWNYWEHRVSGVTSINVSGSTSIDELRLYPTYSQMSSYTYVPLKGISSVCDANNSITYYEYDNYGRLKLIKDFKGNILKTINYAYQSTTP